MRKDRRDQAILYALQGLEGYPHLIAIFLKRYRLAMSSSKQEDGT